jgi:hypothetical protein
VVREIELERFVVRTTTASGVPVVVEDLSAIEQIARVLLCAPATDNSPCRPREGHAPQAAVFSEVS